MTKPILTQEQLKERLHYDPETGFFTWLISGHGVTKGMVAGTKNKDGYIWIRLNNERFPAAPLAFLYMTGKFPQVMIDHKNHVTDDNRWENIREAFSSINQENKIRPHKGNKTGFLGVFKTPWGFRASIQVHGKVKNLGTHETPEAAHQAYLSAKRFLHDGNTL